MSTALNSAAARIGIAPSSGFACGGLLFDSPETRRRVPAGEVSVSSASSSSIGKNSDDESERYDGGENDEAQSSYKGPLDMMNELEEVLPMRRGISKYYNYKSKSFTSLVGASSSSNIKELAKPDNAYTRKRRNLLASNHMWEKNRTSLPLRSNGGGISKRSIPSSRSALALAVKLGNCSESSTSSTSEESNSSSNPTSPRPPLPPGYACPLGGYAAWRSYSLADLQECTTATTANTSRFSAASMTKPNV
ncbi:hypothetical protein TB1_042236 [Malus domestica]